VCLALFRDLVGWGACLTQPFPSAVVADLAAHGFRIAERVASTNGLVSLDDVPTGELQLLGWLSATQCWGLLGDAPLLEDYARCLFGADEGEAATLAQRVLSSRVRGPTGGPLWRFLGRYPHSGQWLDWSLAPGLEQELLAALLKEGGRTPGWRLSELLPRRSRADVARARASLVRRLVLFHDLDPDTLELTVGVLATVRLSRVARGRPPQLALSKTPSCVFLSAVWLRDALALLEELTAGPASLTSTAGLPPEELERLSRILEPIPEWVAEAAGLEPQLRVLAAYGLLVCGGFLSLREQAYPSPLGEELRRMDLGVALERLLPPLGKGAWIEHSFAGGLHPLVAEGIDGGPEAVAGALGGAFDSLVAGRYYSVSAFARHVSFGRHAPLRAILRPGAVGSLLPFEHVCELASRTLIEDVVLGYLVASGGASVARLSFGLAFALNRVGRWQLGLDPEFPADWAPTAVKRERAA
jgi:hypothetical protein